MSAFGLLSGHVITEIKGSQLCFWPNDKGRKVYGIITTQSTRLYQEVPGLAAWNENCKWYNSLPLGAVVSLFCE
jgi:hypothetical protein